MTKNHREYKTRQLYAWLQENFPHTVKPVELRITYAKEPSYKGKPWFGWVDDHGDYLKLNMNLRRCYTWDACKDTMMHEYAHCLDGVWHEGMEHAPNHPEHPPSWGIWFAAIYTAVIDDGGEEKARRMEI